TTRIAKLADDVPTLFEQVLERLEKDHGVALVCQTLSLLSCARHGLLENELLVLLGRSGEIQLPAIIWSRLYRSLGSYLRPGTAATEGAIAFFHLQLHDAVHKRYLRSADDLYRYHSILAGYFSQIITEQSGLHAVVRQTRAYRELPFHQASAGMWRELDM